MICFRCGATVADTAQRCPSCEQELSPGATLAAVPSAGARSRERGSAKTARPAKDRSKSDITHQLSVDDIFDEFAPEEEEFLAGDKTPAGKDEDTTSTFSLSQAVEQGERDEDSSPVLGAERAEHLARGAAAAARLAPEEFSSPETVDEKLQSGPLHLGKEAAPAPRAPTREPLRRAPAPAPSRDSAETVDWQPPHPARPQPTPRHAPARPDPTPRPAPAPPARTSGARPTIPKPSDPDPVTGPVVELSSPKPLPELAPALEPEPTPAPMFAPGRVTSAVVPMPRGHTAVTAPDRSARSFLTVAVIGVALGLTAATAAIIVLVVRQEDRAADLRRERAVKRVQERLRDAERLKALGAAPATQVAPTPGPDGCPQGMRRLGLAKPFCLDMYEYPGGRTLPRSNVTWREARAACQTRGARLCFDKEWDEACRGEGGAEYPYGAKFDVAKCNVARAPGKPRDIAETGARPACKSAASIYDMSGNVAEWTLDGAYRGGSAESDAAGARCSAKVIPPPEASNPYVGFRCCADPSSASPQSNPAAVPASAPAAPR